MKPKSYIIVGAQGSGKSNKAREIANRIGASVEVSGKDLLGHFGLGKLASSPKAVIVEEVAPNDCMRVLDRLKSFINSDQISIDRKHQAPIQVSTPIFILCTTGLPDGVIGEGRRFTVVRCG